jgi:bacterioferritin
MVKNKEEIIKLLNYGLACEFNAIAQYTCHSELYRDLGYPKMAKFFAAEVKEEERHIKLYLERITYLKGKIDINKDLKVNLGYTVKDMLTSDLSYEMDTVNFLIKAIEVAESSEDYGTSRILREILQEEEEHYDLIETLLARYKQLGEQQYVIYFDSVCKHLRK